eukprot:3946814-Pyramimonas_sp.AAC.1
MPGQARPRAGLPPPRPATRGARAPSDSARASASVGSAVSPRGAVSPLALARGRRGTWSVPPP